MLWGDFYLDPKTKRVLGPKHLKGRALKPMFVQLVLDSIWAAYEATTGGGKGKGYVGIADIGGCFDTDVLLEIQLCWKRSPSP